MLFIEGPELYISAVLEDFGQIYGGKNRKDIRDAEGNLL